MNYRTTVKHSDIVDVEKITESTGFFYDHEVEVAVSLVVDTLKDPKDGYKFLFLEDNGRTIGYTCFGEIACTHKRYDIYWIVIHNDYRGKGLGKEILKETENEIIRLGGEICYLETSSTEKYIPTRAFYDKLNYVKEAEIIDFYLNGDNKVIYSKRLQRID
jgi:ribosomal protein S18 acetylase RimI-like enzyme